MKNFLKLLIVISLATVLYLLSKKSKSVEAKETLRIALFTPITHKALEEVELGFKETLQNLTQEKGYTFIPFNANGNRTLLRAQAEEIVHNNYDLIMTMGATCSETISLLLKKNNLSTPHVFCAVDSVQFAQSLLLNKSSIGAYVAIDYEKQIDALYTLKPNIKKILLVYDPTHGTGLEKYKNIIKNHVEQYGGTVHSIEIYQTNEIHQKVAALIPNFDVVLVLIDNTVVAGIDTLIALCNKHSVTLAASDLASGKKGAAFSYGITEYESGKNAAFLAHKILIEHKNPSELSLCIINNHKVSINKKTMMLQALDIDNEKMSLIERMVPNV